MKRFWLATTVMACALLVSPASEAGQRSRPAGAESGGTAVPRGGGGSSGGSGSSGGGTSAPAPSRGGSSGGGRVTSGDSGGSRAVPRGDRPRDGRATVGQAVPRTRPPYGGGGGAYYPPGNYYWWSHPSYWYGYGAVGLGYFYYDPFWWGVPYGGYGYPYYGGYPYGGYTGYPYGGYYGSGGSYQAPSGYEGVGQLRLKVKPKDADVYVDGYRVGIVTNFDGVFQRLDLTAGPHKVEIRREGYETLSIDVRILPDETTTYEGELKPLNQGVGDKVR